MVQLILYTSSECIRCRLVKQMLQAHDVQYEEITDNKPLMMEIGLQEVPAIEVDGKIIDTYPNVLGWLQDKGYYSKRGIYEDN